MLVSEHAPSPKRLCLLLVLGLERPVTVLLAPSAITVAGLITLRREEAVHVRF